MKKGLLLVGLIIVLLLVMGGKGKSSSNASINVNEYSSKYENFKPKFNTVDKRMLVLGELNNRNLSTAYYTHTGNGSFVNKIDFPLLSKKTFTLMYDEDEVLQHRFALLRIILNINSGYKLDTVYEIKSIPATYTYKVALVDNSLQGEHVVEICNNKQVDCVKIGVYDAQNLLDYMMK